MLLPALSKARAKARDISCINNLKQIGLAMVIYMDENNGQPLPVRTAAGYTSTDWFYHIYRILNGGELPEVSSSVKLFCCPSAPEGINSGAGTFQYFSYGPNARIVGHPDAGYTPYPQQRWTSSTDVMLICDLGDVTLDCIKNPGDISIRHQSNKCFNANFGDGHAAPCKVQSLYKDGALNTNSLYRGTPDFPQNYMDQENWN